MRRCLRAWVLFMNECCLSCVWLRDTHAHGHTLVISSRSSWYMWPQSGFLAILEFVALLYLFSFALSGLCFVGIVQREAREPVSWIFSCFEFYLALFVFRIFKYNRGQRGCCPKWQADKRWLHTPVSTHRYTLTDNSILLVSSAALRKEQRNVLYSISGI